MPHSSNHYRHGCVPYKPKTKMMDSHKASSLSNSPISTPTAATHFSGSPPPCDSSSSSPPASSAGPGGSSGGSNGGGGADPMLLFKSEAENGMNGHAASNGLHLVAAAAAAAAPSDLPAFPASSFASIQPRPGPAAGEQAAAAAAQGPVMVTDVTGRPHAVITQHDQLRNLAQAGQLVAAEGGQLYLMLPGSSSQSPGPAVGVGPAPAAVSAASALPQQQPPVSAAGDLPIAGPGPAIGEAQAQILVHPHQHHQSSRLGLGPGVTAAGAHNGAGVNRLLSGIQLASEPCSPAVTPPTPLLPGAGPAISPRPAVQPRLEVASAKEEKRRNNHNEVERRRRDRINQWIAELARMLPPEFASGVPSNLLGDMGECPVSPSSGAATPLSSPVASNSASKGTVLKKVVDYVRQLKLWYQTALQNGRMQEARASSLQQENEQLRREVDKLRSALSQAINVSALVGMDALAGAPPPVARENGCLRRDAPMDEGEEGPGKEAEAMAR